MGGTADATAPLALAGSTPPAGGESAVAVTADGNLSVVAAGLASLAELPREVRERGSEVRSLDLSENDLEDLTGLDAFPRLTTLVADNNRLSSCDLPSLPNLETLWLNKNNLTNLEELLGTLAERCPKLQYLSLLGNVVCKNELVGATKEEAERYRLYVTHRIPTLNFLDAMPVTAAERRKAQERGQYLRVAKADGGAVRSAAQEDNKFYKGRGREGQHSTFLGYQAHSYTGKSSEGNRFIRDDML